MKDSEAFGSYVGQRLAAASWCLQCPELLAVSPTAATQTILPGGAPGCSSHAHAALRFPFSEPSSLTGYWALIFFPGSSVACSQSQLLPPEGIVLSMQHHASAAFSLSLITILSIFPTKGHLSRCLCFFINVCEGKSSLIIMKTIAETPPGEGSSRLCRQFNFRDPLIGKIV